MMNTSWLYQISVLLLVVIATAVGDDKEDKKRKLQIGVKKRVDCERKTRKSDSLKMHYTGKLENGVEFDSSHSRNEPFEFVLGAGQVIKGWDQGLLGMCVGDKRKLVIPPELGYGERGAPPKIPANAVLVFEVELLAINDKIDDEL